MALFSWNSSYSVGVAAIDRQHAGLFAIINDLYDSMMARQAQSVTAPLLKKLLKYTEEHFLYEERAMESTKYPGLAAHRVLHNNLTNQVKDFISRFERGEAALNIELLSFLRDWLAKHIQHEDKGYGPWMNEHDVR